MPKENYCFDCKLLKRKRENFYSDHFGYGGPTGAKWSEWKWRMPMAFCQHRFCFEEVEGKMMRIRGQVQLNKNHDCIYYKEKWLRKLIKRKPLK